MRSNGSVPDDDDENSIHLLPPVLEDDSVSYASPGDGPSVSVDIHRLPATVTGGKTALGHTNAPSRPLMHHLPPAPSDADRGPDLAIQDAAGGLENVPAIACRLGLSPTRSLGRRDSTSPAGRVPALGSATGTGRSARPIARRRVRRRQCGPGRSRAASVPLAVPVRPLDGESVTVPLPLDDMTLATLDRSVATITQRANQLAMRGASFAARAETINALRMVTQALDANEGGREHSDALGRAMRAFHEANDFAPRGSRLESAPPGANGQRPPYSALQNENVGHLAPIAAQQRYLEMGSSNWHSRAGMSPPRPRRCMCFGRIYTALDNTQLKTPLLCLPQAVALHQAALNVDPPERTSGE